MLELAGISKNHGLRYLATGMGVAAGTGTAVTLFCGEPSINRSE